MLHENKAKVNPQQIKATIQYILIVSALKTTFSPHVDMINALLITERNGRMLVVSASSDCSVVLSDIYGNRIGVFGQVSIGHSILF